MGERGCGLKFAAPSFLGYGKDKGGFLVFIKLIKIKRNFSGLR